MKTASATHATSNSRRKAASFPQIKLPARGAYVETMFRMPKARHPFFHAPSRHA